MNIEDVQIGQTVKYSGCSTIGDCEGKIIGVHPAVDADDFDSVSVYVENLPDLWPYQGWGDGHTFSPPVEDIELTESSP